MAIDVKYMYTLQNKGERTERERECLTIMMFVSACVCVHMYLGLVITQSTRFLAWSMNKALIEKLCSKHDN